MWPKSISNNTGTDISWNQNHLLFLRSTETVTKTVSFLVLSTDDGANNYHLVRAFLNNILVFLENSNGVKQCRWFTNFYPVDAGVSMFRYFNDDNYFYFVWVVNFTKYFRKKLKKKSIKNNTDTLLNQNLQKLKNNCYDKLWYYSKHLKYIW